MTKPHVPPMPTPILSIRSVSKRFDSAVALDDVSLDVHPSEILALLGPSGCGKSTLLRIISGFESPDTGELLLDGQDLTPLPPNRRPINMVFQSYAVFPHMTVADNVAYGLKMDGIAADERRRRVGEALEQVHLADFATRMPDQLSGGQRQRVALARALVKRPRLLLLDEPLSALDAKLRDAMRLELVKLQCSVGITFIIVTHDQAEAMAMADRIAVLDRGRLRQVATPAALYQKPVDAFVADFVGSIHCFDVTRIDTAADGSVTLTADRLGTLQLPASSIGEPATGQCVSGESVLAVRPEHIAVSTDTAPAGHVAIEGHLGDVAFQGQHCIVEVVLDESRSITAVVAVDEATRLQALASGTRVSAHWPIARMQCLPRSAA